MSLGRLIPGSGSLERPGWPCRQVPRPGCCFCADSARQLQPPTGLDPAPARRRTAPATAAAAAAAAAGQNPGEEIQRLGCSDCDRVCGRSDAERILPAASHRQNHAAGFLWPASLNQHDAISTMQSELRDQIWAIRAVQTGLSRQCYADQSMPTALRSNCQGARSRKADIPPAATAVTARSRCTRRLKCLLGLPMQTAPCRQRHADSATQTGALRSESSGCGRANWGVQSGPPSLIHPA